MRYNLHLTNGYMSIGMREDGFFKSHFIAWLIYKFWNKYICAIYRAAMQ